MSKVSIRYVNINQEQVILVDGLTLDDIKAKFSWFLNARTKNAIIGKNESKLVWYSGEWLCGEWFDGVWYSGIFHSGIWDNGIFNSIDFDRNMLLNGDFVIKDINIEYSHFISGEWLNGEFNLGTFGINKEYWNIQSKYTDINVNNFYGYYIDWYSGTGSTNTFWRNGNFNDGLFINSEWDNGKFKGGYFNNSLWHNGNFYDGIFDGYSWDNGTFNGGDFIKGIWYDGIVNELSNIKPVRWGSTTLDVDYILCEWKKGIFNSGSFMSGLIQDISGNTIPSINNRMSFWYDGTFNFGKWYGGQFENGTWNDGFWYGGIWGSWSTEWKKPLEVLTNTPTNSYMLNKDNINDEDMNTYASIIFTGTTTDYNYSSGYTRTRYFDFGISNSASTITGVQVRMKRSAFFNNEIGDVKGEYIKISIPSYSSDTKLDHIIYSNNNSFVPEVVYFGDGFDDNWNIGNIPFNLIDEMVIDCYYSAKSNSKASSQFKIETRIYDISVKLFYQTKPIWNNGIWYNGLWINGIFNGGNFKGGSWMDGIMNGGSFD